MSQEHRFECALQWTGRAAEDAQGKLRLPRLYDLRADGKPTLPGSSPAAFGGDESRYNPEMLMVASLVSCHHLTYLAICERAGIRVLEYSDHAAGTLAVRDGKMRMVRVVLQPRVRVADPAHVERAREVHAKAHAHCFMSASVNFEVVVEPTVGA